MTTMSEPNDEQNENGDLRAVKRLYELTIRIRDFEITQLSQRNNFFMIFQGVLFAGLATLWLC
ncbi:RipA family octameric membrane protein [Klebsiella pneumoniae]